MILLKIDFNPDNVLQADLEKGRIVVKVEHFGPFANGCHLSTVSGSTMEDFDKNSALRNRSVLIGVKGGITSEGN